MRALVTGGAGFIGSHLADALLAAGHPTRVLDDLSAGSAENVPSEAELIVGSAADEEVAARAVAGIDVVFHLGAHRSVARSVDHPLTTDTANTHGTLTILKSAADAGVRRVVYSSSSSVYGGAKTMPTPEEEPTWPRSPYAVSKLAGEHYCRVYAELYGLETVSLRYFNVYGPRQRPDSAYAAVIPLFIEALRTAQPPVVHGDGRQSRSFVYVADAVAANIAAATARAPACAGQCYNVAGERRIDLLEILKLLGGIIGVEPVPLHADPRPGDVRHTDGNWSAANKELGWAPQVTFEEGLDRTVEWFASRASRHPAGA